jgi:hypothetical protein
MTKRFKLLLFLTLPVIFIIGASSVNLTSFTASISGVNQNVISLKWSVANLDNINRFEIERKMHTDDWKILPDSRLDITSEMKNIQQKEFEYTDSDVFKTNSNQVMIQYRLRVVQNNGLVAESQITQVQYTTSAVRRTWGSIKSMFQ